MLLEETIRKLRQLRLHGMADELENQRVKGNVSGLSFEDRVGLMVDVETTAREDRRLKRLVHVAHFKESACLEDLSYGPERGLNRSEMASLAKMSWVKSGLNLIISGQTGTGKTWLACAIGNQACRYGLTASFQRVSLLLEELSISHSDGSFTKRINQLGKFDLLILDDFGISSLNAQNRNDLLEVIDARSTGKSTLVTSQLPVSAWRDYLGDKNPTVAEAILDRIVGNANRLTLSGPTMRSKRVKKSSSE